MDTNEMKEKQYSKCKSIYHSLDFIKINALFFANFQIFIIRFLVQVYLCQANGDQINIYI